MRYDKQIFFVKEGEDEYNDSTGNYEPGEPTKEEVWANVSDMGTERMSLLYGSLQKDALTVRIRGKFTEGFDYMEINKKPYQIDHKRTFRHDQAFEVSGV